MACYVAEFDTLREVYTPNKILRFIYPMDSELENQRSKIPLTDLGSTAAKLNMDINSEAESQSESKIELERRRSSEERDRLGDKEKQKERVASQSLIRSVGLLGES